MNLTSIRHQLQTANIFHSEINIVGAPTMVGYEKKFKWSWLATQLNTFIVATDFGENPIDVSLIEQHLSAAFQVAMDNYTGWPKGLQSGVGVIGILLSSNITEEAKEYCLKLKSGKKWAGFTIPVAYNTKNKELFQFEKNPIWGRIYYPHFRALIDSLR